MRIIRAYYVVYDGQKIVQYGSSEGKLIETSQCDYVEFDTEEEMLSYIQGNNLELQDES